MFYFDLLNWSSTTWSTLCGPHSHFLAVWTSAHMDLSVEIQPWQTD